MELRAHVALWSALAFMACAAPVAWLFSLEPQFSFSDVLALIQTIASVLALGSVLAVAVWEYVRLRRSEEARRTGAIALAKAVTLSAMTKIAIFDDPDFFESLPLSERYQQEAAYLQALESALARMRSAAQAINAIVPTVPQAQTAVALSNLAEVLEQWASERVLGNAKYRSYEGRRQLATLAPGAYDIFKIHVDRLG